MSKIIRKKSKKPITFRRKKHKNATKTSDQLKCAKCSNIFSNVYAQCPQCGSEEWTGYEEINPYTRMPLEVFLQLCGHLFWLGGTALFLFFMWQTNTEDAEINTLYIVLGIISIAAGLLVSAGYFALSEIILRLLRVQRRLKAFHNTYKESDTSGYVTMNKKRHRSPL